MTVRLIDLSKSFGDIRAVAGVDLELEERETVAILGPSGCGKSTLLRLVAGLERPDRGRVLDADRDITSLPPQRRPIGMVFQDYALFPHLDVAANVGFALVEQRRPAADISRRVAELLQLVGLQGSDRRRVYELSGGQQQRVALARALAPEPSLLLLDEPLSNLDAELRLSLQAELRSLLRNVGVKALYVTHDQAEAFALADRVALMRNGRIVQLGRAEEVRDCPRSVWAARFLGYRNIYGSGALQVADRKAGQLLLREDLVGLDGQLPATVEAIEYSGYRLRLSLTVPSWGAGLFWEGYRRELPDKLAPGDEVRLYVPDSAWLELEES